MPKAKRSVQSSGTAQPDERAEQIERLAEFLHDKTVQCCFDGKGSSFQDTNANQRQKYRQLAAGLMDDAVLGPAIRSVL